MMRNRELRKGAAAMWLDPCLQNFLIRARIAEAQRKAALRELVRQAKPSDSGARRSALIQHIVRAASTFWLKRRIERAVLP